MLQACASFFSEPAHVKIFYEAIALLARSNAPIGTTSSFKIAMRMAGPGLKASMNGYVLEVAPDANKMQIREAVEKFFKVKVESVNTVALPGKFRRLGAAVGGYRPRWKKAYIRLKAGQDPARPFCLFGNPDCFVATDNVTAINYEVGMKGELFDNLQLSIAVFNTNYKDLPYQVSTTTGAGFNTQSIVVDQTSRGAELETTWAATDNFRLHATVGYIDVDVDDPNPAAVAPLTPELTASLSPELTISAGSGEITLRADWSYRDDMFGEPSSDPARFTFIESRDLINSMRPLAFKDAEGTKHALYRTAT